MSGLVHSMTEPVLIGPPPMALIFRECCSGCVGMLSRMTVSWAIKLPGAPELIRAEKTETDCFLAGLSVSDLVIKMNG